MAARASQALASRDGEWRPAYWALAALPGAAMALFEIAQVALYAPMRAPNVSFAAQALVIVLVFYAPTALIGRAAWIINRRTGAAGARGLKTLIARHAVAALGLGTAHLVLVTVGLALLHSPPGWIVHLPRFVGENWLGKFPLWATVYAVSAALLLHIQARGRRAEGRDGAADARIELRRNGKIHVVALADILWVEAMGNYVVLHTERGAFTLRETLAAFARRDRDDAFMRVHRGALVRADRVRAIRADGASGYRIEIEGGAEAPLSRRRAPELRHRLQAGG